MYPLIQVGPFNLSTSGLLLLVAIFGGQWLLLRVARARGGDTLAKQADSCFFAALLGAFVGGRLWYGGFNWDIYSSNPGLFLSIQPTGLAWPGALLGGGLAAWLLARRRGFSLAAIADSAALVLPLMQAVAAVGLLLGGEAFGQPTDLPWGVDLLGTTRHPTQLYLALAGLLSWGILRWLARRPLPAGALAAGFLLLHGLTLLLVEAFRADSLLLPGGIRGAQVCGLGLMLAALWWARELSAQAAPDEAAPPIAE